MKKITITMEENTHEWLRAQAARERIGISHCVRNLVDQARVRDASSELPLKKIKRAVIAGLMREAVERTQQKANSQAAHWRILERRKHAPSITEAQFRAAREKGRP